MTMSSKQLIWCLSLVISLKNVVIAVENNIEPCNASGFGYELLQQRLDQLQFSFMEVFVHVKELGELVTNNQRTIEQNQLQTNQLVLNNQRTIQQSQLQNNQLVQSLENQVAANVSLMVSYSKQILDLQTICANHESIKKELFKMNSSKTNHSCYNVPADYEKSCDRIDSSESGLFNISIATFEHPVAVFCEMQKFGSGWLVFQHRFDGSVDFYRNWTEYKNGFGNARGEFWLGLEKIYQITKQARYELMIDLETFTENYTYARYSEFEIDSEGEKYALKKLGTYRGTAGDQLSYHKGMKFSTFDSDNDLHKTENCAVLRKGAWWYNACVSSNLNGPHLNKNDASTIYWNGISAGHKFSRMMMRKIQ